HTAASDCDPTTPSTREVFIVRRPDGTLSGVAGLDFGCRGPTSGPTVVISGVVFDDLNRDGMQEPGEAGVPDVVITGSTPLCPTFAVVQVRTGSQGEYKLPPMSCLPPFIVQRSDVPGFVGTTPNPLVFPGLGVPPTPNPVPPQPILLRG